MNLFESKKYEKNFSGAGDFFTSLLSGYILKGVPLKVAVKKATLLTEKAIKFSVKNNLTKNGGVAFYSILQNL